MCVCVCICVCICVCVCVYVCVIIDLFLMCTRVVHRSTCAGILPTQYMKFSMFAGMGGVGHRYVENCKL